MGSQIFNRSTFGERNTERSEDPLRSYVALVPHFQICHKQERERETRVAPGASRLAASPLFRHTKHPQIHEVSFLPGVSSRLQLARFFCCSNLVFGARLVGLITISWNRFTREREGEKERNEEERRRSGHSKRA